MHSIPSLFWLSVASALVAVVGFVLVHRVIKPVDLTEHQSFLDAMLSIVGTLVSILLGLLVASALSRYQSLEQSADTEAANVAQLFRLSAGLPKAARSEIQELCIHYSEQVLHEEWSEMSHRHASMNVTLTYFRLLAAIITFKPQTNGETNIHAAMINAMQQVGDCRRGRLMSLDNAWTKHLLPVLFMCAAIVLAFAYLYGRRQTLFHAILICLVAIALGTNLGLIFILSNPFAGDWKIQPQGFQYNVQFLRAVNSLPEFKPVLKNWRD